MQWDIEGKIQILSKSDDLVYFEFLSLSNLVSNRWNYGMTNHSFNLVKIITISCSKLSEKAGYSGLIV